MRGSCGSAPTQYALLFDIEVRRVFFYTPLFALDKPLRREAFMIKPYQDDFISLVELEEQTLSTKQRSAKAKAGAATKP